MSNEFLQSFTSRVSHTPPMSPLSSLVPRYPTPDDSTKRCSSQVSIMHHIADFRPLLMQSHSQTTSVAGGKFLDMSIFSMLDTIIGFPTGTLYGPRLIPGATGTSVPMVHVWSVEMQTATPFMYRASIAPIFAYEFATREATPRWQRTLL